MHARDLAIAANEARSTAGISTRLIGWHPSAWTSSAAVGVALVNSESVQLNRRPSVNTNWQLLLLVEVAPEAEDRDTELEQPSGITSTPLAALDGAGFAEPPHPPTHTARTPALSSATKRVTGSCRLIAPPAWP